MLIIAIVILISLALIGYHSLGGFVRYYTGPVSDHFDGERFFNPGFNDDVPFDQIRKWQNERRPALWPLHVANKSYPLPPTRVDGNELHVTFVGHATFLIQTAGLNILTDPFLSDRASPLSFMGPKRVRAPGLTLESLPKIDVVLVSHNHYDHLDRSTLKRIIKRDHPKILTPLGNDKIIPGAAQALDWTQSASIGDVRFTLEQAYHWTARGIYDRRKALWGAFVIQTPAGNIYFAGDTGYRDGKIFKDARAKYGQFRLALLPIGAYEPQWFMGPSHMGPHQAVEAFKDLGQPIALGMHFQALQLTDEAIDAPAAELTIALRVSHISEDRFIAPDIGQSFKF